MKLRTLHKLMKQLFNSGNYFSSLVFLTIYILLFVYTNFRYWNVDMRTPNISTYLSLVFHFAKQKNFVFIGSCSIHLSLYDFRVSYSRWCFRMSPHFLPVLYHLFPLSLPLHSAIPPSCPPSLPPLSSATLTPSGIYFCVRSEVKEKVSFFFSPI